MYKSIYAFDDKEIQKLRDKKEDRNILGGKGAGLADMTRAGLPVPPGFTITTEECTEYTKNGVLQEDLKNEVREHMKKLEKKSGKQLGGKENPLLLSVRSGARVSMPGMMDTVLNLGLNDDTVKALAKATKNERFAYDCYRRFVQMFGDVVLGVEHAKFEKLLAAKRNKHKAKYDSEVPADGLKELVNEYKDLVKAETGGSFPEDPYNQLFLSIEAVFKSWDTRRAQVYREANGIPDDWGTAVNVMMMAYGNMGGDSGTGVAFTRDPSTGENILYGEYLVNAQGEDVVAGIRTPKHISKLKEDMPEVFEQFVKVAALLEKHYCDMQDMEFTVEKGKLYMLQTRSGKRTAAAAIKIAADMVREGLITKEEAVMRITPANIDMLLHPNIDPKAKLTAIAKGLPASPGAGFGRVSFSADDAVEMSEDGKVVLVAEETTPDDLHGMIAAQAILTSRGGMTCHAAVVARGMGKPTIVGCEAIHINGEEKYFKVGDVIVREGETITVDGTTGNVIIGEVPLIEPELNEDAKTILGYADGIRRLGVRANADTPVDSLNSVEFGAEGIGLCRTEHMFLGDRVQVVQKMILAETDADRNKALEALKPLQKQDYLEMFEAMNGKPVIVRLLDPPLHEFLPSLEDLLVEVTELRCKDPNNPSLKDKERMLEKVRYLHESNPMLGHRGCRLAITFPDIYRMQVEAIYEAAAELKKKGLNPMPKVMIPLVVHENELIRLVSSLKKVAEKIVEERDVELKISFGTMIEIPRAALTADEIAKSADFFSFGTNDLTQTTYGFSRDDAEGKFLQAYMQEEVLEVNPFEVLDRKGVGQLVKMAVELGKKSNPKLEIGVCGETGGEPNSIEFYDEIGLDYVSCSPYRVPVARLAAAQAAIKNKKK
ncbi:MAG: pyruvate, phosphate dikinase [Candidatus Diapherotrites archaeon]|nr:pyruvate, phosphate dikinase [Candidatus Diapherotrites archaeon]